MLLIITPDGSISESPLTRREMLVLEFMAKGLLQKQIAQKLSIKPQTAKKHIGNAYKKLGAHSKVEALRKSGLWSPIQ